MPEHMTLPAYFQLIPEYRDYIWGGSRLRPGYVPTAEAWIVYENNPIVGGPLDGKTLAQAVAQFGPRLLGGNPFGKPAPGFPLLIKLLDCADWLSLQVHPNDEIAARLEGPGYMGKTEAWHVLEAAEGARLIAGVRAGINPDALQQSVMSGTISNLAQYHAVQAGDTLFMPAGTLHALGPGLLIYEVQQASDLTYRVYDWGRPQTEKRRLHIEKSLLALQAEAAVNILPDPQPQDGKCQTLVRCPYFTLDLLHAKSQSFDMDTQGNTFHAMTVIKGAIRLSAGGETVHLEQYQTVLVPAATNRYQLRPIEESKILVASTP
jgi:mannose-6-phosphate isomerase